MIEKLKHLIYKEWLKTRWYATIALLLSVGTVIYIFISIRSDLNLLGAPQYFSSLILEKSIFFGKFKYIPIITALLIGLSQFVPEVTDKRIKLSLHLPMENTTVIYSMVLFGFAIITAIQLISVLLLTLFMSVYFPSEIIIPSLQTILPWILGGMTCYFFIAMISLEPIWKYRFLYIIFVYFVLRLFYYSYGLGNAVTIYPILFIITLISSVSVIYTSHRFNKGEL